MTNDFGIGAALALSAQALQQMSRRTGRTTHTVSCVRDGEGIVVPSQKIAQHVERLLRAAKVTARVIVCAPNLRAVMQYHGGWPHRVHFEHSWVEAYYAAEISLAQTDLFAVQGQIDRPLPEPIRERFE